MPMHCYRLKNHTIRTTDVINEDFCKMECYQEANCISYNFKKKKEDNGRHKCDLNNATYEHDNEHSGDLVNSEDYVYHGAEVHIKDCNYFTAGSIFSLSLVGFTLVVNQRSVCHLEY